MSDVFKAGERALFLDKRGRRYLVTLREGAQFHTHQGFVAHAAVIGCPEGARVVSSAGAPLIVVRPSLTDFILKMPRGAQVVYPKDIGAILIQADIFPGATVVEAGTGSGALTIGLLRAVGERGRVITYELRDDHAEKARTNLASYMGGLPDRLDMRMGDITEPIPDTSVDRFVLDMSEPWRAIPTAVRSLRPGGVFCSYVPSTVQVSQVTDGLRDAGFIDVVTTETLVRTWHVEGQSVRPDHRMVAHTGFVTTARYLDPAPGDPPEPEQPSHAESQGMDDDQPG